LASKVALEKPGFCTNQHRNGEEIFKKLSHSVSDF
jgi:hypothetical protein